MCHRKVKLLYIDPQSGFNLAQYDYSLLSNLDAEITYCCSTIYDAPIVEGVCYKYLFDYNKIKIKPLKAISYIISIFQVAFLSRKIRPDVIHIQWWRLWIVDYFILRILKLYTKQIVFTAHNVLPHDSGESFSNKCKKYYQKVDKIIVHTNRTKEELIELFGLPSNKIFVIPHGLLTFSVDDEAVNKQLEKLKKIWSLENRLVFSLIGYQSWYKGTDILKRAFETSSILKNNPNVLFIVAGKGNVFTKEMMHSYDNLLIMDDFVPSDTLEALMNITDVQILPYRIISQSGVLLTAIEKEIPYISTNIGGLSEPIEIASIGWLLQSDSFDELRTLLEYLAFHPNEILEKKLDVYGWSKIKRYYNWKSIGKKTLDCYKK